MSEHPKLVLEEEVMRFVLSLAATHRRRLLGHFDRLRSGQNLEPDFREQDRSGRWLSVQVNRPFLITYWLDSPVNELRIVDVEWVRS